ncbi:MAG: sigma-70 family RNA polymerase sigma factor [Bacteroidaceae bacterium]|nr:sigma-70 family RNA polymerase sigma factor [Bacteroidaceae bacterium]
MERETVQRLFMQHYARMYRLARTLLYDEQDCEDVVSDIFESLLAASVVLLPEGEERYLLTSVRNRCLKRLRHEAIAKGSLPDLSKGDEPEDERLADIMEFVTGCLSAQEQRIFGLRFTEGLSYEEIASSEGISRVAVWKHLSHAITAIKNQFNRRSL